MTLDEDIRLKLEAIRESIVALKFATDNLLERVNRVEQDLCDSDARLDLLSDNSIRTDETIKTIVKATNDMSVDIRAVRNSILSTIIGASLIWLVGTAFTTFYAHRETTHVTTGATRRGTN